NGDGHCRGPSPSPRGLPLGAGAPRGRSDVRAHDREPDARGDPLDQSRDHRGSHRELPGLVYAAAVDPWRSPCGLLLRLPAPAMTSTFSIATSTVTCAGAKGASAQLRD